MKLSACPMGLPAHQVCLPSWDAPTSHPDREIPSRLGTTKIKCTKWLISHGLPLHTLHHAIYYLLPLGIGMGFPALPIPLPMSICTHTQGYGFWRVWVGVLKNIDPFMGILINLTNKPRRCECQLTLPCRPVRLGRSCVMGLVTHGHRACRSCSLMQCRCNGTLSMWGLSESRWSSGS